MILNFILLLSSRRFWCYGYVKELVLWILSYFVFVNDRMCISNMFCEHEKAYVKLVRVC
jgi:hypothetical protein